jgi:quercetin dioxygenase-like cupin family protein
MTQPVIRTPLLQVLLSPGRTIGCVDVQCIEFGPGQKSPLHLHPYPVMGNVLRGSVLFAPEGQRAKTLQAGDAFYEPANTRILHFDNASETEPMAFVAAYLLRNADEAKLEIL